MPKTAKKTKKWIVYKLVNRTNKEVYFGISRRPMHSLHDHEKTDIPTTGHWDFRRDDIEHHVIYTGLGESTAISKAKALARLPDLAEFVVINTFDLYPQPHRGSP